jgi:hypothetical protein
MNDLLFYFKKFSLRSTFDWVLGHSHTVEHSSGVLSKVKTKWIFLKYQHPTKIGRPGRRHSSALYRRTAVRALGLLRLEKDSDSLLSAWIGVSFGPGASMAGQARQTSLAALPHDRIEPKADYRRRLILCNV